MSEEQSWIIETADLQVGTTLSFDLMDANGQVLHKAGLPISERLKERLQKKNIHSVTVHGQKQSDNKQAESLLIDSFPTESIAALQASMGRAQQAVQGLVEAVRNNGRVDITEVSGSVHSFVDQASTNMAAALAVLAIQSPTLNAELASVLFERSAKLSLLGVITSIARGDETKQAFGIGLAALVHDLTLHCHPEWFAANELRLHESALSEYRRHPIESVELLSGTDYMSKEVATVVTQVHEQLDGTGYPRGLKGSQISSGALVLNVADAYLALVEPLHGTRYIPTDALAYLCFHAAQGRFCTQSLQSMLQCMSMYPIGSIVILDDESKAVVVESNSITPLQPIVRSLQSGNVRIDLAATKRSIVAPYHESGSKMTRLQKQQIQEILWRTDC